MHPALRDIQAQVSMSSPVVANIYMEHFEDLAMTTAPNPPRVWKRYVDDTFCIMKKTAVLETLDHLNGIRPTIQFTVEEETEGVLPFLDTQLNRGRDGTLDVTVFRKKTHTDRYLQFESHHPMHVKRGVVKSLFNRAQAVTLREENVQQEVEHLEGVLQENGYPRPFIRKSLERRPQPDEEEQSHRATVVIPYVAELSERVRRVCKDYNIRTAFKSASTLRTALVRVKDPIPMEKKSGVVYEVPCSCGKVYIGETKRTLETRMKEHRAAARLGQLEKSAVAEHAWQDGHTIDWSDVRILDEAPRNSVLLIKEALHIRLRPPEEKINRDLGLDVPECWVHTIKTLQPQQRS